MGTPWELKRCRPSTDADADTDTDLTDKRRRIITDTNAVQATDRPGKKRLTSTDADADDVRTSKRGRASPEADPETSKRGRTCTDADDTPELCVDMLASLPNYVLGLIVSRLPTKDVAAMQVLSKGMGHVLSLLTSVDIDDDSRICPCKTGVDRFPLFESFMTNVLPKLPRPDEESLTRFRLHFSIDKSNYIEFEHSEVEVCYPYLEPARLNAWISYPLFHTGLKDLDLAFLISNRKQCKLLPPELFNFPSLEFFRLQANVRIDGADVPLICLPNVKLLHVSVTLFEDDFITRLVSSSPVLEDLSINCYSTKFNRVTISSHSVRRMVLVLNRRHKRGRSDRLTIDTPNVEYFDYSGDLPYHYSITHMNALVEAKLYISYWYADFLETSLHPYPVLLSAVSHAQHFKLRDYIYKCIPNPPDLTDHLSMFRNLRSISLPPGLTRVPWRGDIAVLSIIHSSPLLETLVFPKGYLDYASICAPLRVGDGTLEVEEAAGWERNRLPSCCSPHLRRIELGYCFGTDRELIMIEYFLRVAPALEELVLTLFKDVEGPYNKRFTEATLQIFLSKLEKIPRASNSCSIILRRH